MIINCSEISDLFVALIGASIGGLFTIFGTWLSYYHQRTLKKDEERNKIISFINSIETELEFIWKRYYETLGKQIELLKENEGLNVYYHIHDNYFIIYDSNTNLIGCLDKKLASAIVETYILAKSLKDTIICNNQFITHIENYSNSLMESKSYESNHHYTILLNHYKNAWQNYGIELKKIHFLFKEKKDVLIRLIQNIS